MDTIGIPYAKWDEETWEHKICPECGERIHDPKDTDKYQKHYAEEHS